MQSVRKIQLKAIRTLVHQLAEYGLNPADWQLFRRSQCDDGELALRHRYVRDFQLKGRIKIEDSRVYWSQLDITMI